MEPKLISADTHLCEPPDLWTTRLPRGMRDRAARLAWTGEYMHYVSAGGHYVISLSEYRDLRGTFQEHSTLERWQSDNLADGVWGQVIHPNVGLLVYTTDNELAFAHARVYNDYVAEMFGDHFDRHKPTAIIPVTDIDDAIAEVERAAGLGLRGIVLPVEPTLRYNSPTYDKLWAAAQAHDMVAVFHIGVRTTTDEDYKVDATELMQRLAGSAFTDEATALADRLRLEPQRSLVGQALIADLVGGGVPERFPRLHFVLTEFNAYWLAGLMAGFDKAFTVGLGQDVSAPYAKQGMFDRDRAVDDQPFMVRQFGMTEAWPYPLRPSEYIRRQFHCTFQDDPAAIALRGFTGVDALLWGSDYPHHEGCWPRSREALDLMFAGVPAEDRWAITGGTTAKLFGFTPPSG
jgi:predicted TIM-barrel fold metal-dependent hydrolase